MIILIADEIEESRIILKKNLEHAGHSVVTASNGSEALALARSHAPDIIVSDVLMPEMDGFMFCREVKHDEQLRNVPFIMYTATCTEQQDEELAFGLGAARYIHKPVENDVILQIIQEVKRENEERKGDDSGLTFREPPGLLDICRQRIQVKLDERIRALERERNTLLQKEAELLASEEKYRSIFNNVNDAIFIHNIEDAGILDVNQKMCEMFGYTREEALNLRVEDLSAEDPVNTAKAARKYIETAIKEGPQVFEWQCRGKTGRLFWVEVRLKLIMIGGQDRIIAVVRDITRSKKAREQLLLIQASIDNSEENIFWIDKEARFINVNNSACIKLGYTKEEMLSMTITDIAPHYPSEKWSDQWNRLKQQGSMIFETRHKHKNGRTYPVEVKLSYMKFGSTEYIFSFVRDITERKKAEEELRETEDRFRAIFEHSPVGITIANSDGTLVDSNAAFQKMLGYENDELFVNFSEITHPEDIAKNLHLFNEMIEGKRDYYRMEKRYFHKNGSIVWANLIVTAIKDRNGEFKYNFAITENITERKKLEDQLRHAQKMEAVGQLAGGVAHDFNNILTAIIGYGSLLKMRIKDEALLHNVNQILTISERGSTLTQDLLAFSRKQAISLKPVKINELVKRIGHLVPRLIGEDFEFREVISDDDMVVMADGGQLEQVLMNLAANARDAMRTNGVLTITTDRIGLDKEYVKTHGFGEPGPYARITVTDSGAGIAPDIVSKIFEPFFTTKEIGEGTGLGLSLVYGIIKQHNGYINVYSESGKGTSFKIYLPLMKDVFGEQEQEEELPVKGGSETILLAEDEEDVRDAIKSILEEFGFTVIEAVNGKDAVKKFTDNKDGIHLLLLDVVMPKMNGKEAYEEIKKMAPEMKAIFTSGYTAKIIHSKGVLEEGINFIPKPVQPYDLLIKIREVLDES